MSTETYPCPWRVWRLGVPLGTRRSLLGHARHAEPSLDHYLVLQHKRPADLYESIVIAFRFHVYLVSSNYFGLS